MENYKEISYLTENKLKTFDSIDFGVLGITLISLGSLFGVLKKDFFKKIAPLLTIVSILGSLYVFIKFSKKDSVPYIKTNR
ncbi:MAG: hypothetical protein E7404_04460 [Ruminococcaceae bacterium]|nr:hypothetical protein [Oscillospiraceae bacterium]